MTNLISISKVKLLVTFGIIVLLGFYVICYKIIFDNDDVRPFYQKQLATDTMQPIQHNETTSLLRSRTVQIPKIDRPINTNNIAPIHDYFRYPCVKGTSVGNNNEFCPRTVCTAPECKHYVNCTFLHLRIINNARICTYDPNTDFIAKVVKDLGGWEDHLVHNMMEVLRSHPDMMLFDIGCNIGVYTLVAAWMGRHVVCVDANYENIHMVYRSLQLANLLENVTLVWNGLSMGRGEVKMIIAGYNVGGARIYDHNSRIDHHFREISLQTILLDDLQHFAKGKPIFMKMDVEEYELNVLIGGRQFLTHRDVKYVQMEFNRSNKQRPHIAALLQRHGFLPFREPDGLQRIAIKAIEMIETANADVYFIKAVELLKGTS